MSQCLNGFLNPLPHNAILSSSYSAANKDVMAKIWTKWDTILSHNNPCFQRNIVITNFLVTNTCEIRFHVIIGQSTVPMYSYAKILKHG